MSNVKEVWCYETKQKFKNLTEAKKFIGLKGINSIKQVLNISNRTAAGYHWCNDLSIFDNVELTSYTGSNKIIYCYETKEKFNSMKEAATKYKIKNPSSFNQCLNNYKRTAYGYHWCTDLSIFEGIEVIKHNRKPVYCYETKQKFKSQSEAAKFIRLKCSDSISNCMNNPNKVAGGYHWCSDLSIFDNIELINPMQQFLSSYESEIVEFLNNNNLDNIIQSDRIILSGKELDIYLPDYNLAIEFNGDYWHSELKLRKYKTQNSITYHQDKTLKCLEKGVELISIFEFQWNENKELYLNYILDRINGIDRPDLELDSDGNHILQFCNKKYFTEKQDISEPSLFNYEKHNIYDCGKIII